jgi:iron complex outermembrane receptor protein
MKMALSSLKHGGASRFALQMTIAIFVFVSNLEVQAETNSSVQSLNELKKLSFEELLDTEVTSVSKRPEKLVDAASAIQVITGEEIRRSGASSFPEALRLASNLQVAQKNAHEWVISARGFSSDVGNKLLVLVDGRTVYTPLFSGVFWDRQDYLLEDVDRIEVISGPGGALWGANAVNGVINIITKSAKDTQGIYLEAGGGTWLQDFTGLRYGGTLSSNVSFRVYGKYFDRDDEVFANGNDASDSWRMGQGGFRIDAEPSSENLFTLQGDGYGGEENIVTGGSAKVSGGNILGRWSHTFSDESNMSLQMYYDRTHLALPTPPLFSDTGVVLAPSGTLKDDLDTFDLDFQHRFGLGERNHFVWGLGYRFTHDVVENSPALAFFPTKLDQDLFSGFAQDEIALVPDTLNLTLGSKLEHNDYTGFEVEPSGRLQWNLTTNQMIWAAVSRAVRMPSRVDRHERLPTPALSPFGINNLLVGGANFSSETVIAYELGYRAQLGQKVAASVSGFYNKYDDIRSTSTNPPPAILGLPLFYENNLEAETYGFELSVNYQMFDWWRWHGGYNLLEEDVRVKSGYMDFNNALNETADPQQQFSLRSSMNILRNVEFDTGLRWVDTLHVNNAGTAATVPSYFELDVRLGWQPTENLELSLVGQNLLHDHHPEFGVPSPTRVEIVRAFYGKVTWRF